MYRNYVNNIKYRIFKEMIIFFRKKIRHESKISDQRKEREFKISLDCPLLASPWYFSIPEMNSKFRERVCLWAPYQSSYVGPKAETHADNQFCGPLA